jgi:L-ascorbate metabolism protein UlaG (beta-lactamase superfamily)
LWSDRASPVRFAGPRRITAPGIAFDDLPPIDTVLLSHNHYDHLDIDTLRRLHARHRPLIVTPLGNDAIIRGAIPDARLAVGDWHDRIVLDGGTEAHIVPAHHWSAQGTGDRLMALWCGFTLRTPAGLVHFAGDTGYGDGAIFRDMQQDLNRKVLERRKTLSAHTGREFGRHARCLPISAAGAVSRTPGRIFVAERK